jgi:Fe-S oxidoreductase
MTSPAVPSTSRPLVVLDDDRWERFHAATNGRAAACFQCGTCTATCPWGLVAGSSIGVRSVMRNAQLGVSGWEEAVWRCTTCGACEQACPHQVPVGQVMLDLRSLAWKDRRVPHGLSSVLWDMEFDGNPWGRPPSERSKWAAGLVVPQFDPATHEVLLYIGCTASYDRRAQKIARAVVSLLQSAGVSFGTFGDREPCCGDAARSLGHAGYLEDIVDSNLGLFDEAGVKDVITVSPHCYDTFARYYRGAFGVKHYARLAAELVSSGRLVFDGLPQQDVTFHDPCYLARHHEEVEAPRTILRGIPGVDLVEMERSQTRTLCCGGGGGRMWMETPAGERFADARVREAATTGATALVTTCPHCISCLSDGISVTGSDHLQLMDLAELAVLAGPRTVAPDPVEASNA